MCPRSRGKFFTAHPIAAMSNAARPADGQFIPTDTLLLLRDGPQTHKQTSTFDRCQTRNKLHRLHPSLKRARTAREAEPNDAQARRRVEWDDAPARDRPQEHA